MTGALEVFLRVLFRHKPCRHKRVAYNPITDVVRCEDCGDSTPAWLGWSPIGQAPRGASILS